MRDPIAQAAWPEKHPGFTLPYVCAFPERPQIGETGEADSRWGPFKYVVVREGTFDEWLASATEIQGAPSAKAIADVKRGGYTFYEIVVD